MIKMASDDNRLEKGRILCRAIIEMMGAPKEHIEHTLKGFIGKIKEDPELEVIKEELNPAEKQDQFWSAFAEIEVWMKDSQKLIDFCFNVMPSSIEIIDSHKFEVDTLTFSGFLNEVLGRLHEVDMTLKQVRAKNTLMDRNSRAVMGNMVQLILKDGEKDIESLAKETGLPKEFIIQITNKLIQDKLIKEENEKYSLMKK